MTDPRLVHISTQEAANAFLPTFLLRFNARFSQEAKDKEAAWVTLPEDLDVAYYFCVKEARVVKSDQTLSYLGQTLLLESPVNLSGKRVWVHVTPDGALFVYLDKQRLAYRKVEPVSPSTRRLSPPSRDSAPPAKAAVHRSAARRRAWLLGQGERPAARTESLSS